MSLRARYLSASQEPAVRPRLRRARLDLNRDETVGLHGPHSVTSLLTLQQTAGNRAVVGALARSRDGAGRDEALGYRSARDFSPLPDKEEEEDITRRRERTTQADPGHRAQGGGGAAPAAAPPAAAPAAPARVPRFPARWQIRHNDVVSASSRADWQLSKADYAERFAWVMWNSRTKAYSVTGKATGNWLGVNITPRPNDAPPLYHVGEYHLHPPLPPAQRANTHTYPVGPSGADTTGAAGADNPGFVRDFATTRRRTKKVYYYGPYRRTGAVH
jgi:hypothetical protein